MRINVNLASQKYRDAREFYVRWVAGLGLALAITLGLSLLGWYNYKSTADDSRRIRELRDKIAKVEDERKQAEAVLNRPENQDVRDQSQFWNDVIDQKSFSWTQLFSDLEKIMPARAYVTNAQPAITLEKRLQLHLVFVGEKHDDAIELLSKMERSERFRSPEIKAEEVHTAGLGPGSPSFVQFEIQTYYTPASPAQQPHLAVAKERAE
ncbi:MAG TPA: hypothetical protein VKY85_15285 [Candidatus Angelobacter sp.]|nr:hypothetical protein [Candidatus Angelobacter sp.]